MKGMTLDPGLEELLRAVATDPDSTLLRVPRPERLRGLFERADPGQLSSVGRTSAERALLDTHRAELAWLLGEAARTRLIAGEEGKRFVSRYAASGEEWPLLGSAEIRERLDELPRELTLERAGDALAVLNECVTASRQVRPSPRSLSSLAFALQPSPRSRWIHAMALVTDDEPSGAVIQAGHLIEAAPRSVPTYFAWELICVARARQGRMQEALRAQISGLEMGLHPATGLMNRLIMAGQAGDTRELAYAARALDEAVSEADPQIDDYITVTLSRRGPSGWQPTVEARAIVASARSMDRVGASRRILDVLR